MGIEFKFNIKRKITINGKEYTSPDEVPEQYRPIVTEAPDPAASPEGGRRITDHGITYDGPGSGGGETRPNYVQELRKTGIPGKGGPGQPPTAPEGLSKRMIIILLLVAAAVMLLEYLRRG